MNPIEKATDKDQTESTEVTRALLSFKARDVYGNMIVEDKICSFYAHSRYILFFNFILKNPLPSSQLSQVSVALSETLDPYSSLKTFAVDIIRPLGMSFESIFLNYTLYDGINYKNGILVKYYTNNNF
jgi:hypothetical protein